MRYSVKISKDGSKIETEVLDRGDHDCKEIVNVCTGFGKVIEISDKDDENPVHEISHINRK
jgi:hypothetical protein